jgi:hypothetical protein
MADLPDIPKDLPPAVIGELEKARYQKQLDIAETVEITRQNTAAAVENARIDKAHEVENARIDKAQGSWRRGPMRIARQRPLFSSPPMTGTSRYAKRPLSAASHGRRF